LIQEHPSCLPIAEIDPTFSNPVPICTELNTPAGPIDNFMVTASGLPVLVECKLWRNPEMRRQVVSQILDYAKELSRWSSSDLQREVSLRLGRTGNELLELVRKTGIEVDEADFNDALTANLKRGRFLLLIVGDGIREGVEVIAEYLQAHAGLHFTLGLVELPIYSLPNGHRMVVPRIMAKSLIIRREVIAVPEGYAIANESAESDVDAAPSDPNLERRLSFLHDLVAEFRFSDPDQPPPKPTPKGYLFLPMPAPSGSCWINISVKPEQVGIWLVGNKNTVGDRAIRRISEPWEQLKEDLGDSPELRIYDPDRAWIIETMNLAVFENAIDRERALKWLREKMDRWVSVLRPRIRTAVAEIKHEDS
jgi:hypothetical protein